MKQTSSVASTNTSDRKAPQPKRIDPLFNDAFIRVFGREDSKNLTKSFINAIFREIGIEELDHIDAIHSEYTDAGEIVGCKSTRFDVLILTDNRVINLESERHPGDIVNRALLYASRLMSTHTDKGVTYDSLPHVIVIALLDTKSLFTDPNQIVYKSSMCWNLDGSFTEASDRLYFIAVDMKHARKRYNISNETSLDELAAWLYALTIGYKEPGRLDAIMEKFPSIEEFANKYDRAITDPELLRAYERAADAWREEESLERFIRTEVEAGRAEARAEGLAEGRAE